MLQRVALQYLNRWRNTPEHKPLVIRGARQVGKTTLIDQFDTCLYLNLNRKRDRELFEEDEITTLIDRIRIHCNAK